MSSANTKNAVLSKEDVSRKLRRMALEIAERNTEEKEIVLAAVNGNGEVVAAHLLNALQQLKTHNVSSCTIHMNKRDPLHAAIEDVDVENKVLVLVDDVANTGKTMFYALKPCMDKRPRKIQTLVLVERSHKLFPVQTDYAGLSLATTLQSHISVETEKGEILGAWLE